MSRLTVSIDINNETFYGTDPEPEVREVLKRFALGLPRLDLQAGSGPILDLDGKSVGRWTFEPDPLTTDLDPEGHYVSLSEDGWAIQHALSCRPHLLRCSYHIEAVSNGFDTAGLGASLEDLDFGVYRVVMSQEDETLYLMERVGGDELRP